MVGSYEMKDGVVTSVMKKTHGHYTVGLSRIK